MGLVRHRSDCLTEGVMEGPLGQVELGWVDAWRDGGARSLLEISWEGSWAQSA